jgi:hypothetical protein
VSMKDLSLSFLVFPQLEIAGFSSISDLPLHSGKVNAHVAATAPAFATLRSTRSQSRGLVMAILRSSRQFAVARIAQRMLRL